MSSPDDDDADEAVEAALDALDTRANPRWRTAVRGGTVAQLVAGAGRATDRRHVNLNMPRREYDVVAQMAATRGITFMAYVRQCVATSLVEEHGVDPATIPWLTKEGLLP